MSENIRFDWSTMKSRDPRDHKPNRSTLELHPDFIAQLNEFALRNRNGQPGRRDQVSLVLCPGSDSPCPSRSLGNIGGWTTDL
jgi:hypothetical protein